MLPEGIDIKCCDCLGPNGLLSLEDGSVDAIITDQPYGRTRTVISRDDAKDISSHFMDTHNRKHPNEKPLMLMMEIVELTTEPGDLVCDPFLGSGTTAEACYRLGRRFVGYDINPQYVEIAKNRLRQQRLVL